MNFSTENIELFDRYNEGLLSVNEQHNFEKRLSIDPSFKSKFDAFLAFEKQLTDIEISQFKNKLSEWDKQPQIVLPLEEKKSSFVLPIRLISTIAALVTIGFLAVNYFFSAPSSQEMITSHFTPYDNVITVRGTKEDLDEALQFYEEKNFKSAIILFEKTPKNNTALFYCAESYLALNEFKQAIPLFEKTLQTGSLFSDISAFHLALAHLGAENIEEAIKQFQDIQPSSDYFNAATDLLEQLK